MSEGTKFVVTPITKDDVFEIDDVDPIIKLSEEMKRRINAPRHYKATYQDRALNKRSVTFRARCMEEAIRDAFSVEYKKAEEKLITVQEVIK